MRKIPTLFVRDFTARPAHVTPEVTPGCEWVMAGEGEPTRKYDGTCVMLDTDGDWWARREVKPGKVAPDNFAAVEHDDETGKTVGWEPVAQSSFAKIHALILEGAETARPARYTASTYELVGPKINGNPECFAAHELVRHDDAEQLNAPRHFDALRDWLYAHSYEGIVWHHPDGRMAKLKAKDYPRPETA